MAHWKNDNTLCINTTQRTQKFLELKPRDFYVYLQFGKGKKNKKRPRVVVNWVKGLKKTRNKTLQQKLLQEANVKVPTLFNELITACDHIRNDGKVVGKLINHSRARGIKLFDDPDELWQFGEANQGKYYYQSFHDMNREWRIHISVYHDEPVVAYRKCLRQEAIDKWRDGGEKPWVRNIKNCYFKLDSQEDQEPWFDDMVLECKKAIDVLDMDIAGVDIGENNKNDGDYIIYEVNSASAMEKHTRTCYQKFLEDIINIKAKGKGLI